jgi:hypothetical protein
MAEMRCMELVGAELAADAQPRTQTQRAERADAKDTTQAELALTAELFKQSGEQEKRLAVQT